MTNYEVMIFKNVSKDIALICLKEMRKIRINSFNMNHISNLNHFRNLIMFKSVPFHGSINYHRCHPQMRFDQLLKIWSKEYQIPIENMLLLRSKKRYHPDTEICSWYQQGAKPYHSDQRMDKALLKALEVFTKDMDMINKYLFTNVKVENMKYWTFLIFNKSKLEKIKIKQPEDPIKILKQKLNDNRSHIQLEAIQKLKQIANRLV